MKNKVLKLFRNKIILWLIVISLTFILIIYYFALYVNSDKLLGYFKVIPSKLLQFALGIVLLIILINYIVRIHSITILIWNIESKIESKRYFLTSKSRVVKLYYELSDTQKNVLDFIYKEIEELSITLDNLFLLYNKEYKKNYGISNESELYFRLKNLQIDGFIKITKKSNRDSLLLKKSKIIKWYKKSFVFNESSIPKKRFSLGQNENWENRIINNFTTLTNTDKIIMRIIYRSYQETADVTFIYNKISSIEPDLVSSIQELIYRFKYLSSLNLITEKEIGYSSTTVSQISKVREVLIRKRLIAT